MRGCRPWFPPWLNRNERKVKLWIRQKKKLFRCLESVKKRTGFKPEVALVPGVRTWEICGWDPWIEDVDYMMRDFQPPQWRGIGRFVFGYVGKVPGDHAGRVHYYEGILWRMWCFLWDWWGFLGAKTDSHQCGRGSEFDFEPGDFMPIVTTITTAVPSPWLKRMDNWAKISDMSEVYSVRMQKVVKEAA